MTLKEFRQQIKLRYTANVYENVSDREGADFGFIAQELEEVLPEVVHTRGDGYKTVMYEKVVPVLVQAMKEQQKMIEALRAEIDLLKTK